PLPRDGGGGSKRRLGEPCRLAPTEWVRSNLRTWRVSEWRACPWRSSHDTACTWRSAETSSTCRDRDSCGSPCIASQTLGAACDCKEGAVPARDAGWDYPEPSAWRLADPERFRKCKEARPELAQSFLRSCPSRSPSSILLRSKIEIETFRSLTLSSPLLLQWKFQSLSASPW